MALNITQYKTIFRKFLKDHELLNRLLNFEEENLDDYLEIYLEMALGFLNSVPPYLNPYTYGDFPVPALLIHQATIEALISNSVLSARNDLTYNNGGITVKVQDGQRYAHLLGLLMQKTDMEIKQFQQLRISININGGWGYSPSPYINLAGNMNLTPNSIL